MHHHQFVDDAPLGGASRPVHRRIGDPTTHPPLPVLHHQDRRGGAAGAQPADIRAVHEGQGRRRVHRPGEGDDRRRRRRSAPHGVDRRRQCVGAGPDADGGPGRRGGHCRADQGGQADRYGNHWQLESQRPGGVRRRCQVGIAHPRHRHRILRECRHGPAKSRHHDGRFLPLPRQRRNALLRFQRQHRAGGRRRWGHHELAGLHHGHERLLLRRQQGRDRRAGDLVLGQRCRGRWDLCQFQCGYRRWDPKLQWRL
mmetsp:Transcript_6708/g.18733  ORF Transcript_6708/g.18733 Transcript_6708/m.18733 type:complete len:255 (-) Transcript_6708:192-956(-)